jgi:membrane-associated phospholipid phosphatase
MGAERSHLKRDGSGGQAYRIGWLALLLGLGGAIAVLRAAGMHVDPRVVTSWDGIPFLLGALLLLHVVYARYRPVPVVALTTGSFFLMIGSALLAGIIANAGMRLRYPLIDLQLVMADRALGMDAAAITLAIAGQPWIAQTLGIAYGSIFPLAFLTAVALAVRGRTARLGELTLCFGGGILLSAIASVFYPALGSTHQAGLDHLSGRALPTGSGIYHLHAVAVYRDGIDPLLDLHKLEGVVTFPSFHMVMALAVAYAFRSTGVLGWVVSAWCALVVISTIPIGGHYVIDLVAGTAVWAAFCRIAAERRHSTPNPDRASARRSTGNAASVQPRR